MITEFKDNGCITTMTKKSISILTPKFEQIDIVDIAAGLSNQPHFGGQYDPKYFFSIAEHCLMVCHLVPQQYKLAALLHDASEAYLGDMKKPIKNLIPEFKKIEDNMQTVILERFGVNPDDMKEIKGMDIQVQLLEYNFFYYGIGSLGCMAAENAMEMYMKEFKTQFRKHRAYIKYKDAENIRTK